MPLKLTRMPFLPTPEYLLINCLIACPSQEGNLICPGPIIMLLMITLNDSPPWRQGWVVAILTHPRIFIDKLSDCLPLPRGESDLSGSNGHVEFMITLNDSHFLERQGWVADAWLPPLVKQSDRQLLL